MKEISGLVRDAKVMFLKKWSQSSLSDVGDHSRIEHRYLNATGANLF